MKTQWVQPMPQIRRPRKGSHGFSPRKRAKRHIAHFNSWPEREGEPKLQGFAGYKAGMTHAFMTDYRPTSTTSQQEVSVPVTIIEVPPLKVAGIRFYERAAYGLQTLGEVWTSKTDKELERRIARPPKGSSKEPNWDGIDSDCVDEVRAIVHTQPTLISGVPKKSPDLMEIRIGGGGIPDRITFARSILGTEIGIEDFTKPGQMIDVASITKGKGFQGHVKRWGVKLLSHKDSKHRRKIGTTGPWNPHYTLPTVPQAGQMGYHQRTEYNKRVLKIGQEGEEITPNGGFLHYGVVRSQYLMVHGSIPGPTKRMVSMRDPTRFKGGDVDEPSLSYISTESKQGA